MSAGSVAFYVSQDLDIEFQVGIICLRGNKHLIKPSERLSNPKLAQIESNVLNNSGFLISLQVFDGLWGRNMTVPVFTQYSSFRNDNEGTLVTLPIKINQLSLSSVLRITLWEFNGKERTVFYKLETPLYNSEDCSLKRGYESLKFEVNGGGTKSVVGTMAQVEDDPIQDKLNKFYQGEFKRIGWLDRISLPKLQSEQYKRELPLGTFILTLEYPFFKLPVVYTSKTNRDTPKNASTSRNFEMITSMSNYNKSALAVTQRSQDMKLSVDGSNDSSQKFYDPDQFNKDPVEEKYRRLERVSKDTNLDKRIKPDTDKKRELERIIELPPGTKLTTHQKGLIWKYRYYLMDNKKALTKLLLSTNFSEDSERVEVLEMMESWVKIDIDSAIELLDFSFTNLAVRSYAVNRLKEASDKELELYLLQLVQAADFENSLCLNGDTEGDEDGDRNGDKINYTVESKEDSPAFLSPIVTGHMEDALSMNSRRRQSILSSLHESKSGRNTQQKHNTEVTSNGQPHALEGGKVAETNINNFSGNNNSVQMSPLSVFLVSRALGNPRLGTLLNWYLISEAHDKPYLNQVLEYMCLRMSPSDKESLNSQLILIESLTKCSTEVRKAKVSTAKRTELLQHLLSSKLRHMLQKCKPIRLPLDPSIFVVDVIPEKSKVFKSSLCPLMVTFKTTEGGEYPIMYKVGDDLRQDQLVIQVITLMDTLLKNENVDLKLTPYKILATGPMEGAIQYIQNDTMASILSEYHGILGYFKRHYPDPNEESGVASWVMDNFVKSCAGYCVITYILGVGDRHLDNLLIDPEGHFFHADFGYILGQDPKPFPPLMKLPPQIIEAMGGADSSNYNKFRSYCFVAYSILRKNARLILNLFELMKLSSIPDIRVDPDGAILKVKERFNSDMSEEQATAHFQTLINDSVNALLPIVIDHLHNLAQYWRA